MNAPFSHLVRVAAAIGGALAIALCSMLALAAFNRTDPEPAETTANVRTVSLGGGDSVSQGGQSAPGEPVSAGNEKVLTINLDAPAFDAPAIEAPTLAALDLGVSLPTADVNAIRVFAGSLGSASSPASAIASASVSRGIPGGTGRGNGPSGVQGEGRGGSGGTGGGTGDGTGAGAGIVGADRVDQPPREPAGNAKPRYPARERELGVAGTVVLRILIDERGRVEDVEVVSGPEAFRRAVLDVARTWRFEPARHRGRVVKVWGNKEVSFTHPRNRR